MKAKKMKILFGVPVKVHKEIAEAEVNAFQKLGYAVEQSYYGNSDQVKSLAGRLFLILKNAINLKRKLIKQKSDIVYLNTAFDHKTLVRDSISIFILKSFNHQVKIVLKTHGTTLKTIFSKSILKKYVLKNTDLLLVLSREELETFKKIVYNKVGITANALDFRDYSADINFKLRNGINEQTHILLYVGRFIKEKGIIDLLNACKIIQEKKLPFKLFCLGSGVLLDEIKKLIKKLDLEKEIILPGYVPEEETYHYYSNCDILILPSYREGFPMAVFQAIAAGKPVITTQVNACADHLQEYVNCLWVKKNNPEDLAEKIIFLCRNKELRIRMSKNNKDIAENFTSEKIAGQLNFLFNELYI